MEPRGPADGGTLERGREREREVKGEGEVDSQVQLSSACSSRKREK